MRNHCRRSRVPPLTTALLLLGIVAQGSPLRPPAVPLVAHDPYFSIWSAADQLTAVDTTHWTGKPQRLTGLVRIDGKACRILGKEPAGLPALPQTGVQVLPTRTIATFEGSGIRLTLTFLTPALPDDLDLLARPLTYLTFEARATDGAAHEVAFYLDASPEITVNEPSQEVTYSRADTPRLNAVRLASVEQPVLAKKGDDLRIDWGSLYLAAPKDPQCSLHLLPRRLARDAFAGNTEFPMVKMAAKSPANEAPVAAIVFRATKVAAEPVARWLMLAYDDEFSIRYFDSRLRPWWRRGGTDAAGMLDNAASGYAAVSERCRDFDHDLVSDLSKFGDKYAELCALAYRQTLAGNKIVADANGQPLMFPKENFSNGCIGTVDVLFPQAPFFLVFSPALAKAMLRPVLDYAASPRWPHGYAPHDLGTYPHATGQVYGMGGKDGDRMPVEECGNMLIMLAALAKAEGNAAFAAPCHAMLTKWADYLVKEGLDPQNQLCSADMFGHLPRAANLALKAIIAIDAHGQLCGMSGRAGEAAKYHAIARDYAAKWQVLAKDDGRTRLAYHLPGSWGMKHNLIWDSVLESRLFPDSVADAEIAWYLKVQKQYGLPVDNRTDTSLIDWALWSIAPARDPRDFQALFDPLWRYAHETPSRVPLSDWFVTSDARQRGFQARPVVGGIFIKMLADPPLWRKWTSRGSNTAGPWAPIPLGEKVTGEGAAETPRTYRRFRVIEKDGMVEATEPIPCEVPPPWAGGVSQTKFKWPAPDPDTPFFKGPVPFVVAPAEGSGEPFFPHNHCPSITWLPNGDLLAVWFSTIREEGTEMTILGSRLRAGAGSWDPASEFFKAADRNMTGSALFHDEATGILHHFNGMGREHAKGWENLALLHRTSRDNGVTWSPARPVSSGARYQRRHQVVSGTVRTRAGTMIQACDATPGGQGSTAIHISRDEGRTWSDPGGNIRGIHAAVAERGDGSLLAFGRGQAIDGQMPQSVSADMGAGWEHSASGFPPVDSVQRPVLLRLREGPLLFLSFTGNRAGTSAMTFADARGGEFEGFGLFGAISRDEGKTWPSRKLLTPGDGVHDVGAHFGANVRRPPVVRTTPARAETEGYLAATQTPDGTIHLISSKLYYQFNLKWLETAAPGPARNREPSGAAVEQAGSTMLAGPWVPGDTRRIDFAKLPEVPGRHAVVNHVGNTGGVNQHNYLARHRGKFWCMWSDGPGIEDRVGQRVKYATSADGMKWSTPRFLTPVPPGSGPGSPRHNTRDPGGFRYISRGFWQRDGELLALASLDEAGGFFGKSLALHAFRLNEAGNAWLDAGVIRKDAINNFPPRKLPSGEWMMSRRAHDYQKTGVHFLVGGTTAIDHWESFPVQGSNSGLAAEEPEWWVLPDQNLLAVFRDNRRSGFVYRSLSKDDGRTWSRPVKTNFPDACSKMCGLRLGDGRYVLVSNPNPKGRDPLVLSLSNDGVVFTKMLRLVGGRQADYPHVIEHDGHLLIAFAGAKSSVEVLKVRLADVDAIDPREGGASPGSGTADTPRPPT